MFEIIDQNGMTIGIDDNGKHRILINHTDALSNKSTLPLHGVYTNKEGILCSFFPLAKLLRKGYENLPSSLRNTPAGMMRYAAECIILDHLLKYSANIHIALVDMEENDIERISSLTELFHVGHRAYPMPSDDYAAYCRQGFDLIVIQADDTYASNQVRLAGHLLSSKGLIICYSSNIHSVFYEIFQILSNKTEIIHIGNSYGLFLAKGEDFDRSIIYDINLNDRFEKFCQSVELCLNENSDNTDAFRHMASMCDHYANEAIRQNNIRMKQKFLDLKEKLQYYLLFADDIYRRQYLAQLKEVIQ